MGFVHLLDLVFRCLHNETLLRDSTVSVICPEATTLCTLSHGCSESLSYFYTIHIRFAWTM